MDEHCCLVLLVYSGTLVATFDRHSLFVWRAAAEITQPLNLHHTRPYTVRSCGAAGSRTALHSRMSGRWAANLVGPIARYLVPIHCLVLG
jgi:hypothetical protein